MDNLGEVPFSEITWCRPSKSRIGPLKLTHAGCPGYCIRLLHRWFFLPFFHLANKSRWSLHLLTMSLPVGSLGVMFSSAPNFDEKASQKERNP